MEAATTDNAVEHPELMRTPWFMFSTLAIYLLFVTRWGPRFMDNRKPFELKTLIIVHNIVQVLSCIFVVYEILYISENTILFFWRCSNLEETPERLSRHFRLSYFLFWLKISELVETVIFVLRKKQNQVTKLHVFHHITTITLIYMLINHNENGIDALFPIFLNSNVHIIMYSYYLIAAVADKKIVAALQPVKKSITVIQMVQFLFILAHTASTSLTCGVPNLILMYFSLVITLMLYGFYDFYTKSYKKKSSKRSHSS